MTRSYIKLDPDLPDRKDYYPDGAFRALVIVFCTASHQPRPGYFRSERLLKALLGKYSRHIQFLLDERDLEPAEGGYHVVGWEAWQEGKYPSVEARMADIRARRRPMTPAERAFAYRQRQKQRDEQRDASRDGVRDEWSDRTVPNSTEPDAAVPAAATTDQDQERTTTSEFRRLVPLPNIPRRTA